MNRLTLKNKDWACQLTTPMYNKLHDLEDIEEVLGIDLITFFKITECKKIVELSGTLDSGVFITHPDSCLSIDIQGKCVRDGKQKFLFKDYGKTWALTKEELEK